MISAADEDHPAADPEALKVDDFEELRRLLLGQEQEQIRALRAELEDQEKRTHDVSAVLPNAVKLSRGKNSELTHALQPAVEGSIREFVQKRPDLFIEAVYPILGPLVRRSIAESLRGMLQTFNRALENTFSWQGLLWRWEALRTGQRYADVVMLRSLAYRVEQIFLFHTETSVSLLHVTIPEVSAEDADMGVGMLSAIQDFGRDWLKAGKDATLEHFRMDELLVWMVPGRRAYLAVVIRGDPPRELYTTFTALLENIHVLKGRDLATFNGDLAAFEVLQPELESALVSQQKADANAAAGSLARVWLAFGAVTALALGALAAAWFNARSWQDFQARLRAEPGIVVTGFEKRWIAPSRVTGLRDPLARQPAALAEDAGIAPSRLALYFKSYRAFDTPIVRKRFAEAFSLPDGAQLEFQDDLLTLSGAAPYEWLEQVRARATQIPGIAQIREKDLRVTYEPGLVLERFRAVYPLPPGAEAEFGDGTLRLRGSAPFEWLEPVRTGATQLPGITAVDDKALRVIFDPKLVLARFENRFGLPEGVTAAMDDRTLVLSGEASHAWIERVRRGALQVSGISALDADALVDLDLRTFQESKSIIESAFIYFLTNKDDFATEGFAALSRLPDEIRRCVTAAKRLGMELTIEVRGHADSTGLSEKNIDLSRRRAEAAHRFLLTCGFDPQLFTPLAMGAPSALPDEKPVEEQSQRRVAFRVVPRTDSARP